MSSSSATHRAFQLRLNPLTGESEWIVIEEGGAEEEFAGDEKYGSFETPESSSLLATTSYLDMLNDSPRNRAFRRAIRKAITGPCHVLDIGAGTGLLSMMAADVMAERSGGGDEGVVSACESYLPMGKLMRRVLRANGMEKKIRVHHKRSDELRIGVDLPSCADVLVSEILDSELLGEGLIPTLQNAHDMLLVANPQTVPYRAVTYGQLVESTFLWKLHDLYSCEVGASDGIHLTPSGLEEIVDVRPKQYAMHCDSISKEIRLLSEPFKIFEFDFWNRPESHGRSELHIKATNGGRIHAVISWWVLQLDNEGSIFYSTAPRWINSKTQKLSTLISSGEGWCDHWKQCVWFIPGTGVPVSHDEEIFFQAIHDDISIAYSLRKESQTTELCNGGSNTGGNKLLLFPERIGIYGDKHWRLAFITAAKNALQGKSCPLCVIADDSVFLTIVTACLSKTSQIISIFPGLQEKGAAYLKAIADANGISNDNVRVLGKRISCLTADDLNHRKVNILMGEPFYCGNEGMLPWQNMRFWKERTLLDSVLSEDILVMPCKGILKACAMSLPDLWRSRCYLKKIEGLDHSVVNETLGSCGDLPPGQEGPCLPYFVWQCGEIKELSEAFPIMEFNISEPIHPCFGKTEISFTMPEMCHGFALWIDWVVDERNSIVISTGPVSRY